MLINWILGHKPQHSVEGPALGKYIPPSPLGANDSKTCLTQSPTSLFN